VPLHSACVRAGRTHWEKTSHRPTDTLDAISTDRLEQAGRALTLALMIMGRETRY